MFRLFCIVSVAVSSVENRIKFSYLAILKIRKWSFSASGRF